MRGRSCWMPFALLALFAPALLAGCVQPEALASETAPTSVAPAPRLLDPLAAGPHAVAWADYDAGTVEVGGPDADHTNYSYDARLRGRVWYPETEGAWPLLVLLHGQHSTCATGGQEAFLSLDDCSDDEGLATAYPNHLGYEYLARHLAGHGYVVASILGHEVNARNGAPDVGMWARGELVLATLDAFRDAADGIPPEVTGRADLSSVGLMGHSRGGEGVVTAVHVNLGRPDEERHALRAVVALAPTDFNARGVPDVALLSLVPYCDGDVSTLHGLRTFDHSRHLDDATAKVQVMVRGANHNFYNSRWYDDVGAPYWPGDDAVFAVAGASPSCTLPRAAGGWRFTPEETERESLVHVAGFLRWQAGGEEGLAPWFTGELSLPEGACPARGCDDAVALTSVMPGARRILVVDGGVPDTNLAGGPVATDGFDRVAACEGSDCHPRLHSSAWALDLGWSRAATLSLRFDTPEDWSSLDVLSLRAAVPGWDSPDAPPIELLIELEDASGAKSTARASDHTTALARTPDPAVDAPLLRLGTSKLALQSVRLPLSEAEVDLGAITGVRLTFEGAGRAFVTDVLAQAEPDVERS